MSSTFSAVSAALDLVDFLVMNLLTGRKENVFIGLSIFSCEIFQSP